MIHLKYRKPKDMATSDWNAAPGDLNGLGAAAVQEARNRWPDLTDDMIEDCIVIGIADAIAAGKVCQTCGRPVDAD
ncbi:MAG: hypothetical protein V3S83_12300 [Gemmatimonadota bacterium]